MVEKCVLCRARWPKDKLYSACRCYKKSDSNRLHKECLAAIYANKETDELPRCPDCHDTYRVSVKYTFMFGWHRCCTCRSVAHLFEMGIIVAMIGCGQTHNTRKLDALDNNRNHRMECRLLTCAVGVVSSLCSVCSGLFTLWLFHHSPEYLARHRGGGSSSHGEQGGDFATYLIYFLFGLTMCLVPFTLKKVFERWRTANSDVEVDIV